MTCDLTTDDRLRHRLYMRALERSKKRLERQHASNAKLHGDVATWRARALAAEAELADNYRGEQPDPHCKTCDGDGEVPATRSEPGHRCSCVGRPW